MTLLGRDYLAGIGRIACAAALIEHWQKHLTSMLISANPSVGSVVLAGQTVDRARRLATDLIGVRLSSDSDADFALGRDLAVWMDEARASLQLRNDYLHNLWGAGPTGEIGMMMVKRAEVRKVPIETLIRDADQLESLGDRAGLLAARVDGLNQA
jgi:hypothetical protein